MQLYIAGVYASHSGADSGVERALTPSEKEGNRAVRYHLESYHFIKKGLFVKRLREDGIKCFLDSGAFSAFSLGVDVNIADYAAFVKDHQDIVAHASVLDAIGDHDETWRNQNYLERAGCEVLPCFHYGEPTAVLEYYRDNYPYITIGGMVPVSTPKLKIWLDWIWREYLLDEQGMPRTLVHGFGLTTPSLMAAYPWYSVDSSSWVAIARNGNIFLPDMGVVPISDRSPTRKDLNRHYTTMPRERAERIEYEVARRGFDAQRMREMYQPRWAFNKMTFTELGDAIDKQHEVAVPVPSNQMLPL